MASPSDSLNRWLRLEQKALAFELQDFLTYETHRFLRSRKNTRQWLYAKYPGLVLLGYAFELTSGFPTRMAQGMLCYSLPVQFHVSWLPAY